MSNDIKLQKFTDAVMADAESEKQLILQELDREKAQRIEKIEEEILSEAYNLIQAEVARIKNASGKDLSKRNMEIRKDVINRRNDLASQVFNKVKERIISYCETSEYYEQLKSMIQATLKELPHESTQILTRKDDFAKITQIIKSLNLKCDVVEDPQIKLGGLRFANEEKGLILDDTFDSNYNEQFRLFEENSGLIIS